MPHPTLARMPAWPRQRAEAIAERYLAQSPADFARNGGDPHYYASLVFAGYVFGPGVDPRDPALGIETPADLAAAITAAIADTTTPGTEAHR